MAQHNQAFALSVSEVSGIDRSLHQSSTARFAPNNGCGNASRDSHGGHHDGMSGNACHRGRSPVIAEEIPDTLEPIPTSEEEAPEMIEAAVSNIEEAPTLSPELLAPNEEAAAPKKLQVASEWFALD